MLKSKLISQRWDEDFHLRMKKLAKRTQMSMTELTVEGLMILEHLASKSNYFSEKQGRRMNQLIDSFSSEINNRPINPNQTGSIKDQIIAFLQKNPNKRFSTSDIARILDIPSSTARNYTKEITEKELDFLLYSGRPNYIEYRK